MSSSPRRANCTKIARCSSGICKCCARRSAVWQGALLVGLDLSDADHRAADQPRQVGLGQIERFAPPLEPRAE
ncbi:MAG TPA: hypothetical protein VFU22_07395 [Roseiflexaceae bacterium]|nr:hypothetical protein [Roseiflexaceae bacterium]